MSFTQSHPASQPDWNNLSVLHRNTLPPRANFYVYNSARDALTYDVLKSKTHSLSGTWKFQHSPNPFEAPDNFHARDFDASAWHDVAVPSMWQLDGFGKGPHYTNVNFPIPVNPPNVPFDTNETGSYVRTFTVPDSLRDSQLRLRFEGVDAAYHVWVNGSEVGYHQGSRNPAEFDISSLVDRDGENTVAVRVYQYCDATYIEDQDQWRMSGIYRDVFLIGFPNESRIEDLFVQTLLDKEYHNADLKVRVDTTGSGELKIELYDSAKSSVVASETKSASGKQTEFSLPIENPAKWTAESPNLYHLVVSLDGKSFLAQRVGFRQVEMKDGLIKVNGKRIVFRGANRHEHHPKFGRAVPYEFMKRDLLLMKTHNINAIRTSHQPSDIRLYDLADELGFWVMDEADLECHGFETICDGTLSAAERALPFRERQLITRDAAAKWTSDNPEWKEAYVDRAIQLVRRDQLHPSVVVWSLGNEAFFGRNHVSMYEYIKSFDDSRPIHYEADIHADTMDMYSRMYPAVEEIIEFAEDKNKTKPLVLCEFVHAMGNGPGNIKEYIDAFYKYPTLQGGFVWEWANHGLLTKDKETGDEFYAYGGDFGDAPNDGNFIFDGVLFSDHTPNPGLIEFKKALEPVQVLSQSADKITLVNRYDFIGVEHLEAKYHVLDDGKPTGQTGVLELPATLKAGETAEIALPKLASELKGEGILHISFRQKEATNALAAGHEIAFEDVPLNGSSFPVAISTSEPSGKLDVKQAPSGGRPITISTPSTTWTFSPITGQLRSWVKDGVPVLFAAPVFTTWRPPTDNDEPQDAWDWKERLLHHAQTRTVGSTAGFVSGDSTGAFEIKVQQQFSPPVLSWRIDLDVTYTFYPSGAVSIRTKGTPTGENLPRTLPRIGFTMELPPSFAAPPSSGKEEESAGSGAEAVSWYGRGPGESYSDKKLSQRIGTWGVRSVSDLWVDYEKPQEGSNRTDTRWLRLSSHSDDAGHRAASLTVEFREGADGGSAKDKRRLFDFQASHYRVADVDSARHPHDLRKKRTDNVVLRLDAAHHGLGSGSCGPRTRDEYALLTKPFEFEMLLQ
ncbi:intracellular beta-galactosidase BgaD [Microdochium bolleyi]|uniref:beta-galactosidase n=1 Tax=Microdochium bolleyi TaxID=196109 RepID=A0A136J0L9_9PEZI|nr:intracellular beta-galactosidase BgaD [Microdochium bolleyi]